MVMMPRTRESFWRRLLAGTLPLLVWSAHFAFAYGLAAAQCTPAGMWLCSAASIASRLAR